MSSEKLEALKFCRVCETLQNLRDTTSEEFCHLNEKLDALTCSEGTTRSSHLKYICVLCSLRLESAFDFIVQCQETYRKHSLVKIADEDLDDKLEERSHSPADNCDQYESDEMIEYHMDYMANECAPDDALLTINFDQANDQDTPPQNEDLVDDLEENCANIEHVEKSYHELFEVLDAHPNAPGKSSKKIKLLPEIVEYLNKRKSGAFHLEEEIQTSFNEEIEEEQVEPAKELKKDTQIFTLVGIEPDVKTKKTPSRAKRTQPYKRPIHEMNCPHCGKLFRRKQALKNHIATKHFNVKYTCDMCGNAYQQRHNLRFHIMIHHLNTMPYKCTICNAGFKYYPALAVHRNNEHGLGTKTGTKTATNTDNLVPAARLPCEICGKNFKTKFTLRYHVRQHDAVREKNRSFLCDHCGFTAVSLPLLKSHMYTHAEGTFPCNECGKKYKQYSSLSQHKKIHRNILAYSCHLCSKKCGTKTHLTQHIMTHTGFREHHCKVCGKGFRFPKNVREHMRVHTGEKPYECSKCLKKFAQERSMKKHKAVCSLQSENQTNVTEKVKSPGKTKEEDNASEESEKDKEEHAD